MGEKESFLTVEGAKAVSGGFSAKVTFETASKYMRI
jgi:hypothetical protein